MTNRYRKMQEVSTLTNRLRIVQGWIEDIEAGEHDEDADPARLQEHLHDLKDREDDIFRELVCTREELGVPTGQAYQ